MVMTKRLFGFVLIIALLYAVAMPVGAVTPTLNPPSLPQIPDISDDIKIDVPDSAYDSWIEDHPVVLETTEVATESEETIPEETVPAEKVEVQIAKVFKYWQKMIGDAIRAFWK